MRLVRKPPSLGAGGGSTSPRKNKVHPLFSEGQAAFSSHIQGPTLDKGPTGGKGGSQACFFRPGNFIQLVGYCAKGEEGGNGRRGG